MDDINNCLLLNEDPIQFDPASVSKTTNVFYDEITEQVNFIILLKFYNYELLYEQFFYVQLYVIKIS